MAHSSLRNFSIFGLGSLLMLMFVSSYANTGRSNNRRESWDLYQVVPDNGDDSTKKDTTKLKYPIGETNLGAYGDDKSHSLDLSTPPSLKKEVKLDSTGENYIITRTIGGVPVGPPEVIPVEEYFEKEAEKQEEDYFRQRSAAQNFVQQGGGLIPDIDLGPEIFDKILQGGFIDIKPQGSAELIFAGEFNRVQNPAWNIRQQRTGQFKFDQNIQLNVAGSIADRLNLNFNWNSNANFEFDNQIKLRYEGKEDDILQSIELGNVSMPTPGTLISGAQSLFGVKSTLRFGRLTATALLSIQRSERKEVTVDGGAQLREFNVPASSYDQNRHFFLSQYFREQWNDAMSSLPVIRSQVRINRIEVWVTNENNTAENTRNVLAFQDLGEPNPYNAENDGTFAQPKPNRSLPDNDANTLYENLTQTNAFRFSSTVAQALAGLPQSAEMNDARDYGRIDNARLLTDREYTFHPQLGFISLNQALNEDEVLAVAFEYTLNGRTYQVGEFGRDQNPDANEPQVLFLKMLKSYTVRPDLPIWDLMMKNVYAINGFQIEQENFRLEVIYEDDESGGDLNYIPETSEPQLSGRPLIRVLRLDRLNKQLEPQPDGLFDFIPGTTILTQNGRIIFPTLEPFGDFLRTRFEEPTGDNADFYSFDALYDSTQFVAEQDAERNKFFLRGFYQSSGGREISIGAINVPEGSVIVTANGRELQENVDYTVDYTLGRVRIINEGVLNSGAQIKVSAESNTMFSRTNKTLTGTRFDYQIDDDFVVGGTFLYLRERPITPKINLGNEPIANAIWGVDGSYRRESRFITKLVDKLPFLETKEKSEILVTGEFAHLIPGSPNIIGDGGTSYLDDFEASEIPIDLTSTQRWEFSSTPVGMAEIQNGELVNDYRYNFKRGKIAWYQIDDIFFRGNSFTPDHIRDNPTIVSNHFMREVRQEEIFPNKEIPSGVPPILRTFDVAYFPNERGIYNFNTNDLNADGTLRNPESNWGGIMRSLDQNNFEANNVQYIEFWLMDPFAEDRDGGPDSDELDGGTIYLQLGNMSEDILKDGLKSFENGIPRNGAKPDDRVQRTAWGYVPKASPINYTFDNDPASRIYQDVGFDGLTDIEEREFFDSAYLSPVRTLYGEQSEAYQKAQIDPAGDNYYFFRGDSLDDLEANVIQRYKGFNNPHGNSPTPEQWEGNFSTSSQNEPDVEDINRDFTLNSFEEYFQYRLEIEKDKLTVGQNYIVDEYNTTVPTPDGRNRDITWYQFKIPIQQYTNKIGEIQDFRMIRFMRMVYTGFQDSIITRFAQFNLVRGDWRIYTRDLEAKGEQIVQDPISNTAFDLTTVNIEENGDRTPIPYVLPPGIQREQNFQTTELTQQNEQSLSLRVCGLEDGDARAAFKNTLNNIRQYERLKMFVHAEGLGQNIDNLQTGDLWLFVRIGTDFDLNYYEYSYPLTPSPQGATEPNQIWLPSNELDIKLDQLYDVKLRRDELGAPITQKFVSETSTKTNSGEITVIGNPDLSNVKIMMIGVRNKKQELNSVPDNGEDICAEVWVNELRVNGFDKKGGWAATGRVTTKLADLGKVTVSGNKTTIGFGGIEQNLQERSQEEVTGVDLQSNLNLGKFFPKESGIRIPMYYSFSERIAQPRFNPVNRDILLEESLDRADGEEEERLRRQTEDFQIRRSLNFTNVQKSRTGGGGKTHIYDIENFSFTYAYTELYRRNVQLEFENIKNYRGGFNYNYNFPTKTVTPFKKLSRSPFLRLITDFNFNYLPQSISFRTELERKIGRFRFRNLDNVETITTTNFDKNFQMRRMYNVTHNLTRSLNLSYQATAMSRIEEPAGELTPEVRDTIRQNLSRLGTIRDFNQKVNANYNVPLNKIPVLDWVSVNASYNGDYVWDAAPPAADSLGNTIANGQQIQLNNGFNMTNLYNKIPFLRTINQNRDNVDRIAKNKLKKMKEEYRRKKALGEPVPDEEPDIDDVSLNEELIHTAEDVSRVLMMVKNLKFNYSRNRGTALPGFMPEPQYLGQEAATQAPGLPFAFGSQQDIRQRAVSEGWLTRDTALNNLYTTDFSENITGNGLIEPIKGFRVNLTFNQRESSTREELFRYVERDQSFQSLSPTEIGNFSTTYFSLGTSFIPSNDTAPSRLFTRFEDYRRIIADRLDESGEVDPVTGYPKGYGPDAQQVLIPAFLASYGGKDPNDINLGFRTAFPAPNWQLTYNGLSKLEIFEDLITNFTINHRYSSNYNVNTFQRSLRYSPNQSVEDLDTAENFEPQFQIQQISLSEQIRPLIGIDITWANNLNTSFQYGITRTLNFSFTNYQLTEQKSREIVIGAGYRTREFVLPFKVDGKRVKFENDLNFNMNMSFRKQSNVIRQIDREQPQPVGGNRVFSLTPNVEYVINKNLSTRIFFERQVTIPVVSTSYPIKNTRVGFSVRYTLGG